MTANAVFRACNHRDDWTAVCNAGCCCCCCYCSESSSSNANICSSGVWPTPVCVWVSEHARSMSMSQRSHSLCQGHALHVDKFSVGFVQRSSTISKRRFIFESARRRSPTSIGRSMDNVNPKICGPLPKKLGPKMSKIRHDFRRLVFDREYAQKDQDVESRRT